MEAVSIRMETILITAPELALRPPFIRHSNTLTKAPMTVSAARRHSFLPYLSRSSVFRGEQSLARQRLDFHRIFRETAKCREPYP
jgi:hypothetical protein